MPDTWTTAGMVQVIKDDVAQRDALRAAISEARRRPAWARAARR